MADPVRARGAAEISESACLLCIRSGLSSNGYHTDGAPWSSAQGSFKLTLRPGHKAFCVTSNYVATGHGAVWTWPATRRVEGLVAKLRTSPTWAGRVRARDEIKLTGAGVWGCGYKETQKRSERRTLLRSSGFTTEKRQAGACGQRGQRFSDITNAACGRS